MNCWPLHLILGCIQRNSLWFMINQTFSLLTNCETSDRKYFSSDIFFFSNTFYLKLSSHKSDGLPVATVLSIMIFRSVLIYMRHQYLKRWVMVVTEIKMQINGLYFTFGVRSKSMLSILSVWYLNFISE